MIQSKIKSILKEIKLVNQGNREIDNTISVVDYMVQNFFMRAEFREAINYSVSNNVLKFSQPYDGRFNPITDSDILSTLLETLAYAEATMLIYADNVETFEVEYKLGRIRSVLKEAGPTPIKVKSKRLDKTIAYYIFTLSILLLFVMIFQVIRDVRKLGD